MYKICRQILLQPLESSVTLSISSRLVTYLCTNADNMYTESLLTESVDAVAQGQQRAVDVGTLYHSLAPVVGVCRTF